MHELSLAESLIELIEQASRRERFLRVHRVHVELGQLSCVMPDALEMAFVAAAKGGCAEGAELVFAIVAGRGACRRCGAEAALSSRIELCPQCGAGPMRVVDGEQMRVTDLDVQ